MNIDCGSRHRRDGGLASKRRSFGGESVFGVHDAVAIPLLGEEPLPVGRKVSIDCVTRNHGVKARGRPLRFGPEQAPEPLSLLLPGAKGA